MTNSTTTPANAINLKNGKEIIAFKFKCAAGDIAYNNIKNGKAWGATQFTTEAKIQWLNK